MKVSYNWLKEYIPLTATPEEVAEVLPMLGLEVEEVEKLGLPPFQNLVVGEVLSREQHPDADRLGVCMVKTDPDSEPRQIVCGATNYRVGDRVPVALPGCILPGDFEIKVGKLRGVESHGMMCSAKELGMGEDHSGLLILESRPEIGTPINEVFPGGDTVFEIELTANRGDCLSHIGVARDLAAYYGLKVKLPEVQSYAPEGEQLISAVEVTTPDCPYYTAWSVRGVKIAPSPAWLKERIEAVGLRSINNVVDVTNYVLMETGQPLHAFDAKKIKGGKLVVRQAADGEKITTLDEKTRTLDPGMMVIADAERPLVVAGVMGSLDAEVDDSTTDIVLESAWFRPGSVRGTARKLILSTDSSYRFARDVDPAGVDLWGRRALDLILQVAGGEVTGARITHGAPPRGDRDIAITGDYVREKCGYLPTDEDIIGVFSRLGFTVRGSGGEYTVTVPSFRPEVDRPIDLVEEFVRVNGTANIPAKPVLGQGLHREDAPLATFNHHAQDLLSARGYQECCHYSLCDGAVLSQWESAEAERVLSLANPLTSEMSHIRASLIPGLLNALCLNRAHGNAPRRFFETGRIFKSEKGTLKEMASVAFVLAVDAPERNWQTKEAPDFYTAKALIEAVAALLGATAVGWKLVDSMPLWQSGHAATATGKASLAAGLLSIDLLKANDLDGLVLAGELVFAPERLKGGASKPAIFQPFSDFPATERDLALVVGATEPAETVRAALEKAAKKTVGSDFIVDAVRVFDVYEGTGLPEGKKSLALSLRFRAEDRTLKDKEVNDAFEKIQRAMVQAGYVTRG